jgi:hypothetical protein
MKSVEMIKYVFSRVKMEKKKSTALKKKNPLSHFTPCKKKMKNVEVRKYAS